MTKEKLIELLALHGSRNLLMLFFITGCTAHFVDYKKLDQKNEFRREIRFVQVVSRVFIFGSIVLFVSVQVFNWFV